MFDTVDTKKPIFNKNLIFLFIVSEYTRPTWQGIATRIRKKDKKMPKMKTKSYLKKRASMTATGKIRVARNAHHKCLLHKSKRANNAGSKPQYLNENMMGQAKILAPYGLK